MGRAKLLWWALPLLGLAELAGHLYFARRAPTVEEWLALRPAVEALRQQDELVVVAPSWAEPLARHALGDGAFPLSQLARPDASAFARAVELGILGQRAEELAGWRTLREEEHGRFRLRLLENPTPARVRFDFVDAVGPAAVAVKSAGVGCPWTPDARPSAGGLHGPMAYPAQRFQCRGGDPDFVGVTLLDDQGYRPRRCVWAYPPARGALVIEYPRATLGGVIRGYGGLSWFLMRDGEGTPIHLEVRVDGRSVGRWEHRDEQGWNAFEFPTGVPAGTVAKVEFMVSSESPSERQFCFQADSR